VTCRRLEFGIYPLGVAGTPHGLAVGPPDHYERVRAALAGLGPQVAPRTYLVDMDPGGEDAVLALADRYRAAGLIGHVTIGCLRDHSFDVGRWTELVRVVVARHGDRLQSLQITNEPNLSFMDGSKPFVIEALTAGVVAAKAEVRRRGLTVDIGFGSVPAGPAAVSTFWPDIASAGGSAFIDALDFVGHNFYVDVFEDPVELAMLPKRVETTLRDLRTRDLVTGRIPREVPVRITENGWPTGTDPMSGRARTDARQASVIDAIVRTVDALAPELGVTHYMLFGLRDADSTKPDLFHQFGILRDDYTPKPAYATYKALIGELG
jgi:hypothetical protein